MTHNATAAKELREVQTEMRELSATPELAHQNKIRIGVLQSIAAGLREDAVSSTGDTRKFMRSLLRGEYRGDLLAGTQTLNYTGGAAGAYLVPQEYRDELLLGMAQIDPLLDASIVTRIDSEDFSLRPYSIPGWDLSSYAAVKVTEGNQATDQTPPTLAKASLGSFTYRCSLPVSMELEEDAFEPTMRWMTTAFQIGFARGIGEDLATGTGSGAPQGIVVGAYNSGVVTAGSTSLTATDIEAIFFSVNRYYRAMPKCAWVMDDQVYKMVRNTVDDNHRPLLSILRDQEVMLGKPVYVSPSLSSSAGGKAIVFGDLEYFVVRCSRPTISRSTQAAGYIETGRALYRGLMRADAKVFDPTGGSSNSPIVYAKLHS